MTEPCSGLPRRISMHLIHCKEATANHKLPELTKVLNWIPQFYTKSSKILNSADFSDVPLGKIS